MTGVLLYLLGILIVLVGVALSIALHELGHLIPAKLFGVKVTQYMIGFGKTLWSRKKGETEYGIKMIPLGGYVSMIGMYPPQRPGEAPRESTTGFLNSVVQEGARGASRSAAADPQGSGAVVSEAPRRGIAGMIDEAREASAETIEAGEDHRAFYRLPMWKKIVVMLGGPFMNLVLAFVFFSIVLTGFGVAQNSTTIGGVNECLVSATSDQTSCDDDDPVAPAAASGMQPGDRLLEADGRPVESWDQFRELVSSSPGRAIEVLVERDGAERTIELTPQANERLVYDEQGAPLTDAQGEAVVETVGMIGATPATERVRQPITAVPAFVGENVQQVAGVILRLPERMVDTWNAAFGSEERDPNGPMSVVGVGRIAGEVVSLDEAPVIDRAQVVVGLLGSLNVALLVFNLVPLMPLDGGHVAGALYEGAKRGIARLRGRPDPGPVDTAKMVPVTFVVAILLGGMSVLLIYADLVKPISLFG